MFKTIYKIMKVFDSQLNPGMPKKVKDAFFDCYMDEQMSNDSFVEWTIQQDGLTSEFKDEVIKNHKLVNDWLIANGAENGEKVLIKYWW